MCREKYQLIPRVKFIILTIFKNKLGARVTCCSHLKHFCWKWRWRVNINKIQLEIPKRYQRKPPVLTDTGEDSKLVHRRKRPKVDTIFSSLFSDASERRVWLSAESKILASTFGLFRLYRLIQVFNTNKSILSLTQ